MSHFKKYWTSVDEGEITSVLKEKVSSLAGFCAIAEQMIQFEEHYKQIHSSIPPGPGVLPSLSSKHKKPSHLEGLLRDNLHTDSDEEDDLDSLASDTVDPSGMAEFNRYLTTVEAIPEDVDIVSWWGGKLSQLWMSSSLKLVLGKLNAPRYPTWASLARDYLAVMASSVSSERAFSSAEITISKHHN